jgi:tRNA A-37 threonylcarbamoyl transferase component Bud32
MDATLWNLVQEYLAEYLGLASGNAAGLRTAEVYSSDRLIYKIESVDTGDAFALKVRPEKPLKAEDADADAAQREYRLLCTIREKIESASLPIDYPAPVHYFPDQRAILTRWCNGQELRRAFYRDIWRSPGSVPNLVRQFRDCGQWLAQFHRASSDKGEVTSFVAQRMMHADRMIAEIEANGRNTLPRHEIASIRNTIDALLHESKSSATGRIHGNFTLRNVLVSNRGAAPVDFEDSRFDILHCDTGQMIADIAVSAYRPLSRAELRRELTASFITGYQEFFDFEPDLVKGFALYHLLATYYESVSRRVASPFQRLVCRLQARSYARILRRFRDSELPH